jgi:hypothetical protein
MMQMQRPSGLYHGFGESQDLGDLKSGEARPGGGMNRIVYNFGGVKIIEGVGYENSHSDLGA